ncbi:hypothetical protein D3C80_1894890 [compost metagenome]
MLAGEQVVGLDRWAERFDQHLDAVRGEGVGSVTDIADKGFPIAGNIFPWRHYASHHVNVRALEGDGIFQSAIDIRAGILLAAR